MNAQSAISIDAPTTTVDIAELVKLSATDSELYGQAFFPRTFRQDSPAFARMVWAGLENPSYRLLNLLCFRGSAKTTRLRTFGSKRIAYGISRTILCVSASERDAILTVQWYRTQVDKNALWAQTFGLKRGRKWDETQIEIIHTQFGHSIWVLAAGITGSLRGINFDDYRPDLILLDDPQTDEMAATLEQREKTEDLILGALRNSLAPVADEPNAKLVMSATPIAKDDVTQKAQIDREWQTIIVPCWTKETFDLPLDQQVSSWEARFPTEALREKKRNAMRRNKLSVFAREDECQIISREGTQFQGSWLRVRDGSADNMRGCYAILGIDPIPPPSPREVAKGLKGKDWECQYVWGRFNGEYHLLECARNRGHDPSWSVATALSLAQKWKVSRIVPEAVNYQRVLKWHLEQEMKRRGMYFPVVPPRNSYKNKFARITGVLHGLATQGLLVIGAEHSEFAAQFEAYPGVEHDDDLDASAMALEALANPYLENNGILDDSAVEEFPFQRVCP